MEYYALTGLTTGQLHKLSLLIMQEIGSLVKAQCHLVWRGHALGVPAWRIVPLVTLGERMAVARMALRVGGRFTAGMLGS